MSMVPRRAGGNHAQHAHRSARRGQRQIGSLRAGQRGGAPAGDLPVVQHPSGHCFVVRTENEAAGREEVGQQHGRPNVGGRHDVPGGDPRDLLAALRGRQFAAHRIKCRRTPLAPPRRLGLKLHAGRQAANHQARQKHHQERENVLRIVDRELPARRHKTEVKRGNAQNGSQNGRAAPQPKRHGDHSQQVDHRQIGGRFYVRRKQRAKCRANHHRHQRPQIPDLAAGQEPGRPRAAPPAAGRR